MLDYGYLLLTWKQRKNNKILKRKKSQERVYFHKTTDSLVKLRPGNISKIRNLVDHCAKRVQLVDPESTWNDFFRLGLYLLCWCQKR